MTSIITNEASQGQPEKQGLTQRTRGLRKLSSIAVCGQFLEVCDILACASSDRFREERNLEQRELIVQSNIEW